MADYDADIDFDIDDDDDGDGYETGQPSSLVKKLRKQLNQVNRQLKDRDAELQAFRSEGRTRSIKEVLAARGVNQKIAVFIPADIEPTAEAVSSWLDEYGDVFGVVSATTDQPSPNVDADSIARMSRAEEQGISADAFTDFAEKIASASNRDELQAILRNA